MGLLIQHGWGKSDKIDRALRSGTAAGVILGPKGEPPDRLAESATAFAEYEGVEVLFDPQFYATQVAPANLGQLPEYGYFRPNLTRRDLVRTSQYRDYASSCLEYQSTLPVTGLISPTVRISTFRDVSSQISLQLADASLEWYASAGEARPLYLSFLIEEQAMRSMEDLGDFIDALTLMECAGFYIIPYRSSETCSPLFEPDPLASFLYLAYVLRVLNDFDVIFGYTDLVGILMHGFGATHTAAGWFQTMRHFTFRPYRPSTGGRQPLRRYTSVPLIDSVLLTDLVQIRDVGMLDLVLSGTEHDEDLGELDDPSWSRATEALHHWSAVSQLIQAVEPLSVEEAVAELDEMIGRASAIFARARGRGVEFAPPAGSHLEQWNRGLILARAHTELD